MISLSALLTKYTLGIMNNLGNNSGAGGGAAIGVGAAGNGPVQNSAAEGSMERGR